MLQRTGGNNFEFSVFDYGLRSEVFSLVLGLSVLSGGVVIETSDAKREVSILCFKLEPNEETGFKFLNPTSCFTLSENYLFHKWDETLGLVLSTMKKKTKTRPK